MERILAKYERKLIDQGLCEHGSVLFGALDAALTWNRSLPETDVLERIIQRMEIAAILLARPAEPYASILDLLAASAASSGAIHPEDCEMRTFIHDIPVAPDLSVDEVLPRLKKRKAVIIPRRGILAYGTVTPEQAFIYYSSVCFSTFVKFFVDAGYAALRGNVLSKEERRVLDTALARYKDFTNAISAIPTRVGPFRGPSEAMEAMVEAGRLTVETRMVDSYFGNISYRLGDTILISQTGSSLDELSGCIDVCPMDGSSTVAVTASSELPAHRAVYEASRVAAILHGHPKFCVIMSMICGAEDCAHRGACHVKCDQQRFIHDIPIVPGEVGGGPTGLYRTLPRAMSGRGAIVWGHGLFTTGAADFREAFNHCIDIERMCLNEYERLVSGIR